MALLTMLNLTKKFSGITAISDFCLDVNKGEILGIFGPNGAGKTTLINVATGFLSPDAGQIIYKDRNIRDLHTAEIAKLGISRTFQMVRVISHLTVFENLLLAYKNRPCETIIDAVFSYRKYSKWLKENRPAIMALLSDVGLSSKFSEEVGKLSYGEQKLVTLACIIANDAELLWLDEPIAGISPRIARLILNIIDKLSTKGKTIIVVEHNIWALREICNRLIFLSAGKKVCEGPVVEVLLNKVVLDTYLN